MMMVEWRKLVRLVLTQSKIQLSLMMVHYFGVMISQRELLISQLLFGSILKSVKIPLSLTLPLMYVSE